jgi:hypothetical protein
MNEEGKKRPWIEKRMVFLERERTGNIMKGRGQTKCKALRIIS